MQGTCSYKQATRRRERRRDRAEEGKEHRADPKHKPPRVFLRNGNRLSGLPNANSQRFSYAISQIATPAPGSSSKSQL